MLTREHCIELDARDPLAPLRAQFELPEGVIYLDGNSLGPLPRAARERARLVIEAQWGRDLIASWNKAGWFALPQRLGDRLAPLIGAGPGEVVVTDTTSVNLFKVLAAALRRNAQRKLILSERGNFPTDLYIAQGVAEFLQREHRLHLVEDIQANLDEDVAVLLLTHVNYRTGAMHDMAYLTRQAHEAGALVIWDLSHSVGAVPLDLPGCGADYAVGSTYKYLNAGPGAPAFLWVAPRHVDASWQPLSGWWSHAAPFAMRPDYEPHEGIARYLCGTQPIVSAALVECGLEVFEHTDMAALRRKSLALSDLFIALVGERLELATPREHARRASQVSYRHPQGYPVMQALIERGVIGDYREPGILRFGLAPLFVRFVDVWDAVERLRDVLDSEAWRAPRFQIRQAVT